MTRSFVIASVALAFVATGCGISPQQACKDIAATNCNKIYTCLTGAELDAAKVIYGADEAACKTFVETQIGCNNTEVCETGKTFDSAQATTCINDYKAQTCAMGATFPATCEAVCK